jgi:peptide/nickel transport system substrate-binding protein
LALLLAVGLLAAACGGDDSGDGGGDAGGDDGDDGGSQSTEQITVESDGIDPDDGAEPQYGGKLVFAREAETQFPWTAANMVCEIACHQAIRGIYDTLTLIDSEGEPQPFLLSSFEPNADFTEWTLTARDGVSFHDGTPLNADALIRHFEEMRDSTLIGNVFSDIAEQAKVDEMTITVTMSNPWSHFPIFLSGQPGYVASPTWLDAAAAGTASESEPVGTGPFVFAEYNDGNNFRQTRNAEYWLSDADGNQYPYLDEIEFVVQNENQTRDNAIISGEIDITHMDSGESIERLRREAESGTIKLVELDENREVGYLLLHPTNEDSVLSDIRIRQAVAYAIDHPLRNQARNAGIFEIANGPYSPGMEGYLDETGWIEFDPDRARELVEEFEADTGQEAAFAYTVASDPFNLQTAELYQQFWEDVGLTVTLDQIEQGSFITEALNGNFEAFGWRNHGGFDPDQQEVWWTSENAGPVGELSLNFGRFRDDVIDENLQIIRESEDEAERTAAAEAINERFAEQVYNIWTDWTLWAIPHQDRVHGVLTPIALPDGGESAVAGIGFTGAINVTQLWVDQ